LALNGIVDLGEVRKPQPKRFHLL